MKAICHFTKHARLHLLILFLLLTALLASSCITVQMTTTTTTLTPLFTPDAAALPATTTSGTLPQFISETVQKVLPAVVHLTVSSKQKDQWGQPIQAVGSGVLVSADGYVLTNRHVVRDADVIDVMLQNRQVYQTSTYWVDDLIDLAVVKIGGQKMPFALFANPNEIKIGDWVIALGSALGQSPSRGGASATFGIVSNLGRSFAIGDLKYYDIIQMDAALNPGNSGGPLFNVKGELIGINSAKDTHGDLVSYAIGIGLASHCYESLVKYGESRHPYAGLSIEDTAVDVLGRLSSESSGVTITRVEADSPAAAAGLAVNDVIVRLNGSQVSSATDFVKQLWRNYNAGDKVKVSFYRNSEAMETVITLTKQSGSNAL